MRQKHKPRIGLALGGGAARGWAHIGVLRWLREHEVPIDVIAGTSIGALIGATVFTDAFDDLDAWVRTLTWQDVVGYLDVNFGAGGFFHGRRLFKTLKTRFPDMAIEAMPHPFGAVATELGSGQEVWFREGSMYHAVRASGAVPGLLTPVRQGRRWLVDGGLVNPVPVSLCRALGAERVIAVDLNADLLRHSIEKPRVESPSRMDKAFNRIQEIPWLASLGEGLRNRAKPWRVDLTHDSADLPSLVDVIAQSVYIMQVRITRARMAGDPPDVLLAPKLGHFRLMDFHRAAEAIEVGYQCAEKAAAQIEEQLA
ncbi:MAG: patatin-like phospholipase family protein [Gammaproteobacteria bacterium]